MAENGRRSDTTKCTDQLELTKFNIELQLKNYSIFEDRSKQYFTYLYNIIQFTLLYYAAMLVILNAFTGTQSFTERVTFSLIAFYTLPVVSYILGLFYCYNSLVLYRIGEKQIEIEKKVMKLAKREKIEFSFSDWAQDAKDRKYNSIFILPYGSALMFYILVPLCIIVIFDVLIKWTYDTFFWVAQVVVPLILWIIYLVFMVKIIKKMFEIKNKINKQKQTTDITVK